MREKGGHPIFVLVLAVMVCVAATVSAGATTTTSQSEAVSAGITATSRIGTSTNEVALYAGEKKLSVVGQYIDGQLLVPLSAFAGAFTSAKYTYSVASGYATLTADGLYLTAGVGGTMLTANDRCLYGVAANRLINGTVWVPLRPLAKAMSLTLSYTNGSASARLTGTYKALQPASAFYNEGELYWLSRIISAESRGEPLRGQMAVGNVVLNRTKSSGFPNTVYGVIFENGQFSPVNNGTVYNRPAWTAVCAAKMCLEGYVITDSALFFCNLTVSPSNWIVKNRTYAFKIGAHTFFF